MDDSRFQFFLQSKAKGFRLVYELSYLVEKKNFGQFFSKGGTLTEKIQENFFSTKYDNSYTNRKPWGSGKIYTVVLLDYWTIGF